MAQLFARNLRKDIKGRMDKMRRLKLTRTTIRKMNRGFIHYWRDIKKKKALNKSALRFKSETSHVHQEHHTHKKGFWTELPLEFQLTVNIGFYAIVNSALFIVFIDFGFEFMRFELEQVTDQREFMKAFKNLHDRDKLKVAKQSAKTWFLLTKNLIENESLILALIESTKNLDNAPFKIS